MSQSLDGKIALVTGGSRGIGAAIAKRLAPTAHQSLSPMSDQRPMRSTWLPP